VILMPTSCRWNALLALLAAAGLVAGCGSGEPPRAAGSTSSIATGEPDGSGGTPDACQLVTAAEVSAAVGATVSAGVARAGGLAEQRTCAFESSGSAQRATVSLVPGGESAYADLRPGLGPAAEDIDGLGQKAVGDDGYLNVLNGDYVLLIVVSGLDGDASSQAVVALARTALSRM
jgi:hypothetical protein